MKIEIFFRHCFQSKISSHKKRLPGFSREKCFHNFMDTLDSSKANVTFFFDGNLEGHFLEKYLKSPIVCSHAGSEAGSFLELLDYIESLAFSPDTILYIVEDDYLHRQGWVDILLEGFSLPVDYVTLYDHRDKYFDLMYRKLESRLFVTPSCHFRTTPSTTNTFATRFETLSKDLKVHRRFSRNREISDDHQKFLRLTKKGRVLVSSVPGWSTHAEPAFASPCTDWEKILCQH